MLQVMGVGAGIVPASTALSEIRHEGKWSLAAAARRRLTSSAIQVYLYTFMPRLCGKRPRL
jgi:hypothetical protein